jgi:hypothetical protein
MLLDSPAEIFNCCCCVQVVAIFIAVLLVVPEELTPVQLLRLALV